MKRYNFNTKLNEEEYVILKKLKDEFAINISQAFKLFLKEHYQKMRRFNENSK